MQYIIEPYVVTRNRVIWYSVWLNNVLLLFLLFGTGSLYSQQLRRIELFNAADGEPIVTAEVYELETRRAITDENGGFTFTCLDEPRTLTIRYFGTNLGLLIPGTDTCNEKTRIAVNLALSLQEVTVTSQNATGTSEAIYSVEKLTRPPTLLGQPDILRGLSLRSGISHGQEGSANIFVRGGTPDQNLILIDDAPVYNVNHLGGFISIFNDDAIRSVSVYKTTPPLVYGNRLSSVIDVRLKNGSDNSWRGKLGIGIVSANAYIEGPLIKDKTTLIAGIRTGYFDLINLGVDKNTETNFFDLSMSDYLIKVSHTFSARHRLFLSSYRSNDVNAIAENADGIFLNGRTVRQFTNLTARYGNQTFSVRDYLEFSGNLQLVTFAYYTDYKNGFNEIRKTYDPELIEDSEEEVSSRLSEIGGATQLRYAAEKADYRLGIIYSAKKARPLRTSFDGMTLVDNPLASASTNFTAFAGYDYRLSERLTFAGGARMNFYRNDTYRKVSPELRGRLDYRLAKDRGLSISANTTVQDLQLLSSGTLGQNTEAYVLANDDLPLQSGWQADIGYHQPLGTMGYLKLGYYYRSMKNVLFYRNNGQGIEEAAAILRETRTGGTGYSHGIEMETELEWKSLAVLLSYTLSRTKHRFSGLNDGNYFPFRYDRPHDISVNLSYPLGNKYLIGANFILQSGIAVTTPTARIPTSDNYANYNVVTSINNARFPSYHRLDLSCSKEWVGRKGNKNNLRLSIYNAYNRINPTFYRSRASTNFAGTEAETIIIRSYRVGQFGLFPSLHYSREFGQNE